jgi:hypothetical protein
MTLVCAECGFVYHWLKLGDEIHGRKCQKCGTALSEDDADEGVRFYRTEVKSFFE